MVRIFLAMFVAIGSILYSVYWITDIRDEQKAREEAAQKKPPEVLEVVDKQVQEVVVTTGKMTTVTLVYKIVLDDFGKLRELRVIKSDYDNIIVGSFLNVKIGDDGTMVIVR